MLVQNETTQYGGGLMLRVIRILMFLTYVGNCILLLLWLIRL